MSHYQHTTTTTTATNHDHHCHHHHHHHHLSRSYVPIVARYAVYCSSDFYSNPAAKRACESPETTELMHEKNVPVPATRTSRTNRYTRPSGSEYETGVATSDEQRMDQYAQYGPPVGGDQGGGKYHKPPPGQNGEKGQKLPENVGGGGKGGVEEGGGGGNGKQPSSPPENGGGGGGKPSAPPPSPKTEDADPEG
jgi:hypothetical protein